MEIVFSIAILVISVIVHEISHGYAAVFLGDPTPRLANRLTLNPLRHIDPVGSVLVPALLAISQTGFVFGWAKPVPINPYNLRGKYGEALVAAAGPASNIILAVIFGLILRWGVGFGLIEVSSAAASLMVTIIFVNLFLAIFNLVPIPPLDGSRLLFAFLPQRYDYIRDFLDRFGLILVLFFAFFLAQFLVPIVYFLFTIIVGL